jgi:hypothetical protein
MFFSTVLAFDIKRSEYIAEVRQLPKMLYFNHEQNQRNHLNKYPSIGGGMIRSRSHPKLTGLEQGSGQKKNSLTTNGPNGKKIPKRLQIVNFWARTRFFQRGFMIWMVLWISNIIYSTGLIEQIFELDRNSTRLGTNDTLYGFEGANGRDLHNLDGVSTEKSQLDQQERNFLKDANADKQLNITGE